ncbi:hypothetical protein J6590_070003 [Homalodisca vitripennis]|nr:hypothetical protein J6590_070003 [Homalodisca vitripennis]
MAPSAREMDLKAGKVKRKSRWDVGPDDLKKKSNPTSPEAHTDYYSIKTKHNKALTEISSKHYKHNIGRSRRNRPVSHGNFERGKREAIVSLPRKMLVKYTSGIDCQNQKSCTIFNNKKYTEENSV